MARLRTLKPSFFTNDTLAEVDPLGRLLFQGLWCIADREGRLEDRPKRIKAEVLPYDDCNVDAMLDELARRDFITRYTAGEQRYIQVTNFGKHQTPHIKEAASTIPAPDKHGASTVQSTTQNAASTPSYLDPDPVVGSSSGNLDPDPPPKPPTPIRPAAAPPETVGKSPPGFDAFWEVWPHKEDKLRAQTVWRKLKPDAETMQAIIEAVPRHNAAKDWPREGWRYCPSPARWLNERRWDDEMPDPPPKGERELIGKDKERAEVMRRVAARRGYEFAGPDATAHPNGREVSHDPLRVGAGRVPR